MACELVSPSPSVLSPSYQSPSHHPPNCQHMQGDPRRIKSYSHHASRDAKYIRKCGKAAENATRFIGLRVQGLLSLWAVGVFFVPGARLRRGVVRDWAGLAVLSHTLYFVCTYAKGRKGGRGAKGLVEGGRAVGGRSIHCSVKRKGGPLAGSWWE